MSCKKSIFFFVFLTVLMLYSNSIYSQTNNYNYSVKNRWTVKASVSRYKTACMSEVIAFVGDNFLSMMQQRKMVNFKVEANYGVNKFIETGIFVGFQHYEWCKDYYSFDTPSKSFAPLLGVNLNFHILPFFVKSEKCHWDLYLTTKYGGCYLPHKEIDIPDFECSKYRQEYGLGLGVSYYIRNIVGFFAEGSVGQFYYFKKFVHGVASLTDTELTFYDFTDSNFSFRIGIAAKF